MDAERIGFLFPGQGAQAIGMGRALHARHAVVRELFEEASSLLGYDLADICFNGPADRLAMTEFSQPALFVTSMAAIEAMRIEHPEWLERAHVTAGLSLGEYTAVCFAGGFRFADGLQLVQKRGQAMQAAADIVDSGMCSILGLELAKIDAICAEVRRPGEVLQAANLLCPGNIAVSGHRAALARLEQPAMDAGAMKVIPLSVAGAFHTSLMEPAVSSLADALAATDISRSRLPVISNVDAAPHQDADDFRQLLGRQVVSPVLWEDSVRRMITEGVDGFLEVGTGRVLRGTLKRIDRKANSDGFGDE